MYTVSVEIAGPAAMWSRPDTGSTPISYPAPTYSATKGIFEAVARKDGAIIRPTHVEICRPIRYQRWTTGYGGPWRKPKQIDNDDNYQLIATILVDVCYRLYGIAENIGQHSRPSTNHAHALQEIFERRVASGKNWHCPVLGWREFVPSYFGPLRDDTTAETTINLTIPSFLHSVFDKPVRGVVRPTFSQDVLIEAGILHYKEPADAG